MKVRIKQLTRYGMSVHHPDHPKIGEVFNAEILDEDYANLGDIQLADERTRSYYIHRDDYVIVSLK